MLPPHPPALNERNPLRLWRGLALALVLVLVVALVVVVLLLLGVLRSLT